MSNFSHLVSIKNLDLERCPLIQGGFVHLKGTPLSITGHEMKGIFLSSISKHSSSLVVLKLFWGRLQAQEFEFFRDCKALHFGAQ